MVVLVRASERWGRSDSFGHLFFEDTAKEQVILNTKPDFLLALKRGYFPQGITVGTGTHGVSKGQKSCLLFFLERLPASWPGYVPAVLPPPHPTFSLAWISWELFLIRVSEFAKL